MLPTLSTRLFCALLLVSAATCGSAPRFEPNPTASGRHHAISTGVASWYGPGFEGNTTASGERFNSSRLTAAHRSLPFGTQVRVTNLQNGRAVDVKINDRGPYKKGRVIDLSKAAAREIGLIEAGIGKVEIRVLSLPGN